jgi:CheY-like chemotaxis protein
MKKKLPCILLIDDDEPTNFLYRIIVSEAGCTDHVSIVQSGTDALDYLSPANTTPLQYPQPDLIFLDINMPRADGWEFIKK